MTIGEISLGGTVPQLDNTPRYKLPGIVDLVKGNLEEYTNRRIGFIKWMKYPDNEKTKPEILRAARKHAVDMVLDPGNLNKIPEWNSAVVETIVAFLNDGYQSELKAWIRDTDRLKLDPKRVEDIEKEVRKVLEVKPK